MALMLCVLLQAFFHIAVLADLQGVATGDVIKHAAAAGAITKGAEIAGAMTNSATATVGPVPIGATEKCPDGLTHRCFDDGCYCVRPSRPVIRPRPRPRPTPPPSSFMTEDAATNGTAATGALTNSATIAGAVSTVIPTTGPVPIDAVEKCPEGLIRRCFSNKCNCGKPPRPVNRPRPRPTSSPKPTSDATTGALINGATANGATATGDTAAGTTSKGTAVAGATKNGATSAGAMANTPRPYGEDASGKCLKGLRRRCLDDGCFCVQHPPLAPPRN